MKALRAIPLPVWKRYGRLVLIVAFALVTSQEAVTQDYNKAFLLKRESVQSQRSFSQRAIRSFPDTVRALAIVVDFQQDADSRTTGDGKFSLVPPSRRVIDPPPHDSAYFANKLLFLENYFRKSSNGKLIVKGEVVGRPITLSKQMSAYSPSRDGSNDRPLADLVVEGWRKADSLYPAIDFRRYDAFIIFHAGVGRDIDLVSLLGFDPAPNDIPSLYVGLSSLRKFLNDPSFSGVPVENGAVRITNTIILPETESRVISSGGTVDTLQLGINGLLASSFGSYLGLPDLFDTKTGRSAIGQFGLMDVASIFAFDGLFPPEPSAWEKIYLGWTEPITVNAGSLTVSLPAVGLPWINFSESDTIYKVPVSAREYFLIENRNRDPQRNGQRLTIVEDGKIITRHFAADTTGFAFNDGRGITGSLIDVEDFDWSMPGLIGANDTLEGGGILIWHIDEDIINRKIAANEVNADPNRRGVALEEADGSLDIGQDYGIFDAGLGTELGSPFDCWFQQNPSPVYKNVFDRNSFPNSKSNTGSRSMVAIKEFSRRGVRMTATLQFGDNNVKPLNGFPKKIVGELKSIPYPVDLDGDGVQEIVVERMLFTGAGGRGGSPTGKGGILAWRQDGSPFFRSADGLIAEIDKPTILSVAFLKHPVTGKVFIAASGEDGLYLWKNEDADNNFLFDRVFKLNRDALYVMFVDTLLVSYGSSSGIQAITLDGTVRPIVGSHPYANDACNVGRTGKIAEVSEAGLCIFNAFSGQLVSCRPLQGRVDHIAAGEIQGDGKTQVVLFVHEGTIAGEVYKKRLMIFDENGNIVLDTDRVNRFFDPEELVNRPPAIADIDGDGKNDIVVVSSKGRLFAFNAQGYILSGFPVRLGGESRAFRSGPIIGDIDADGRAEVLSVDSKGDLWIYKIGNGEPPTPHLRLSGFSFWMPTLFPVRTASGGTTVGLAAGDVDGQLIAVDFQKAFNSATLLWPMYRYSTEQTSYTPLKTLNPNPLSTEFFPRSLVYNWSNPVYGNSTQIRYFVSENASVTVRIFDLAGSQVTELKGQAVGGIDNEIAWDVSGIQSGVYLAQVEVRSGGKTESAVIKIAVVK